MVRRLSCITALTRAFRGKYDGPRRQSVGSPFVVVAWREQGSWEIGILDEVDESAGDESTGDELSLSVVCTSEGLLAADFPEGDDGPTSSELDGAWQCKCKQPAKYEDALYCIVWIAIGLP